MTRAAAGKIVGGRYLLQRQRGSGGLGQVWVALDQRLERLVAVKVLTRSDPDTLARFKREALATAALEHPNIVRALDYFTEEQTAYLVMELLDGVSLAELVHALGKLDALRAAGLTAQVGDHLDVAGLDVAMDEAVAVREIEPAGQCCQGTDCN